MFDQILIAVALYADIVILLIAAVVAIIHSWRGKIPENRRMVVILTFLLLIGVGFLRLRAQLDSLSGSMAEVARNQSTELDHLRTSEEAWSRALDLLHPMGKGWRGYDTSTYPNDREYEESLAAVVKRDAEFRRLFCFSVGSRSMEEQFSSILSVADDQDEQNAILRDAISRGQVIVYHYPVGLSADYLVVEKNRHPIGAVIAFQTDERRQEMDVYTWGISLKNMEASRDLKDLFVNRLIRKAEEHQREQIDKPQDAQCICAKFYDQQADILLPRGP